MKTSSLLPLLLLVACTGEKLAPSLSPSPTDPNTVTAQAATEVARLFTAKTNDRIAAAKDGSVHRGTLPPNNDPLNQDGPEVASTETVTESGESFFHVVTYKGGKGWTVIAADRRVRPVLAYGSSGRFPVKNLPPGLSHWVAYAKRQIKSAKRVLLTPEPQIEAFWKEFEKKGFLTPGNGRTTEEICDPYRTPCPNAYINTTGAFLRTDRFNPNSPQLRWGQEYGYNKYSPVTGCGACGDNKARAGCGPIAISQVMAYWQLPTSAYWYYVSPLLTSFNR